MVLFYIHGMVSDVCGSKNATRFLLPTYLVMSFRIDLILLEMLPH